jgi:very-short-patch-repair endonuclease
MNNPQLSYRTSLRNHCKPEKHTYAVRMRYRPTPAEAILWERLRNNQTGYHFRRQALILGWIVDFYCAKAKLVIEVDGPCHRDSKAKDDYRERVMFDHGLFTLRVENDAALEETDHVVSWIIAQTEERYKAAYERREAKEGA